MAPSSTWLPPNGSREAARGRDVRQRGHSAVLRRRGPGSSPRPSFPRSGSAACRRPESEARRRPIRRAGAGGLPLSRSAPSPRSVPAADPCAPGPRLRLPHSALGSPKRSSSDRQKPGAVERAPLASAGRRRSSGPQRRADRSAAPCCQLSDDSLRIEAKPSPPALTDPDRAELLGLLVNGGPADPQPPSHFSRIDQALTRDMTWQQLHQPLGNLLNLPIRQPNGDGNPLPNRPVIRHLHHPLVASTTK